MQAVSGLGDDELVEMAAMTSPEDALKEGIWTQNQLQEDVIRDTLTFLLQSELVNLQGPVRELVLIPTGQGGFLTHFLAHVVAAIKVCKEVRGCGIEVVITKVENCLADGNLLEAAATLEKGLEGTKGEELVTVWVRHACNCTVAEQAVTMVQGRAVVVVSALV